MKLAQLLAIYPQLRWGDSSEKEVKSITADSRNVEPGSLYVAIRGTQADGHNFIGNAVESGAIALVVEDSELVPESFCGALVLVENSRRALDRLSARFFGDPAEEMFCVGITGTNGKTSVAYLVEKIFRKFGWKVGVMGTVDHHLEDHVWKSELTTPGPVVLQKRLSEFNALHAEASVFEVSSHALDQHRVDNIPFDAVVFTNLSRDHMDYHDNMDHYFHSKERLFSQIPQNFADRRTTAIINIDDPYGAQISLAGGVRAWYFGEGKGDYRFRILKESFGGCEVHVETPRGEGRFLLPLPGRHNVYNAIAALAVAMSANASLKVCCEALSEFEGVPGRLQRVDSGRDFFVFVDYAHTDDALQSVLESLNQVRRSSEDANRLITIFGCGGDRDRGKRPMMAKAAVAGSDIVFITSDNPRSEDPMAIIQDSLVAVPKELVDQSVFVEQDRRRAFARAFQMASAGDIVLIAGKGHEDYQIVGDQVLSFSDVEVAKELLK